jgi:hypothetical protein
VASKILDPKAEPALFGRKQPGSSQLTDARFLWARLSRFWTGWRSALVIVKPETVIAWHRKGFRLFWTWKVRCGQPGRPPVCQETRKLIRLSGSSMA